MKAKLLHLFAVCMAMVTAIPIAKAQEYAFSTPEQKWQTPETEKSGRYYSIAVSGDDIYTFPSVSSAGVGMVATYYTQGLHFSSSKVVTFSGGSNTNTETPYPYGSGSYYYAGPAVASDSKGIFIATSRIGGAPTASSWANSPRSALYYSSNPTNGVSGTKDGINFSDDAKRISGRADKMSAYGDIIGGTGYLWFIPGNFQNTYVGIERITTSSKAKNTSRRRYTFPSEITSINNNISRIMQYSDKGVLLDLLNQSFYKGVISDDQSTISWTKINKKAVSGTGAAMFILGGREILAYSSSATQITLCDVTDVTNTNANNFKDIATFSPYESASSSSDTRHAIDVRVSGNTANIYILVPGQGAAKWTMTVFPTPAVSNLKAEIVSGTNNQIKVSWSAPTQNTATRYKIAYSIDGGATWSADEELTATSKTYSNQTNATYKYKVHAYYSNSNTWGEVAFSNSVTVNYAAGAPITNLAYKYEKNTTDNIGRQDIVLMWEAPIGMENTTVTGYKVYRGSSLLATVGADVLTYTNTGVNQNYTYTVVPLFEGLAENSSYGLSVTTTEVTTSFVAPIVSEIRNYEGYSLTELFYTMPNYAPYKPIYFNLYRDGKLIQGKLQAYNTLDESLVRSSETTIVKYQIEAVYGTDDTSTTPIDSVKSKEYEVTIAPRDWAKTGFILQEVYNVPIDEIAADKKPNLFDNNNYYRQGQFNTFDKKWYIAQRADNLSKHYEDPTTGGGQIDSNVEGATGGILVFNAENADQVKSGYEKIFTKEAFENVGIAMDEAGTLFVRNNNFDKLKATVPTGHGSESAWGWMEDTFERRITEGTFYKRNADGSYTEVATKLDLSKIWTDNRWIDRMYFTGVASNGQVIGRSDYYHMYGDVLSAEGGYLVLSPSWTRTAFKVKIVNGQYVSHEVNEFNRYENSGYVLEPKTGTENYGFHLDGRDDVTVQIRSNGYYGIHEWSEAGTSGWHPIFTTDSRINNAGGTSIQAFGEVDGTGRHTGELFIITPQSMHSHNVGDFLVSRATKASGDDYADEGSLMPSTPVAQYVQTDERSNSTATNANGNWFHAEKGTYASALNDNEECIDIYQYVPGTRFARYRLVQSNQFPQVTPVLNITTAYNDDITEITHFEGIATWNRPKGFGTSTGSANAKVKSYIFEMYNSKNELVASTELPEVTNEDGSPIDDTYEYKFDYTAETGKDDIDFGRYSVNVQVKYETKDGEEHLSEPSFAEASHDYVAEEASDRHIWMYKNANVTEDVWEYDEDKKDWVTVKKAFDNYRIELDFNAPTGTDEPVSYYTIHAYVNNKKDFIQISDFHLHKGAETVNGVTQAILDRDEKGNVIPTSQVPGTYIFDGENSWKAPFYKVGDNYEEVVGGQSRQTSVLTWHHKVPAGYYTSGVATTAEGDDITITDEPNNWKFVVVAHYAANNRSIAKSEEAQFSPELYDFITTGVEVVGDEASSLSIYPIPAHSTITIKANKTINSVVIYNEAGVEVMSEMGDGENITMVNIENLSTGFYFVKVNNYEPVKIIKK